MERELVRGERERRGRERGERERERERGERERAIVCERERQTDRQRSLQSKKSPRAHVCPRHLPEAALQKTRGPPEGQHAVAAY